MIFYGWGTKIKKMCFIGKYFCSTCQGFTEYYIAREVFRITIFFIPVFWHTKHYYIMCDTCSRGREISEEDAQKMATDYINMLPSKQIDMIIDDTIAILRQGLLYDPNMLFEQIKSKYALQTNTDYVKTLIEVVCDLYKDKEIVK